MKIANSDAFSFPAGTGTSVATSIPVAGVVGDVYVALVTMDENAGDISGISSPSITWQLAKVFDHINNSQRFRSYIGKVHTAFNANAETVTASLSGDSLYRGIALCGYRAETGYEFQSNYFEGASSVTYDGGVNPTTTDGYTTTPVLSGNGKHLLIGVGAFENAGGGLAAIAAGTGFTEDFKGGLWEDPGFPYLFESKLYDGSINQAVTCTNTVVAGYGTSLAGIALLMVPTSPATYTYVGSGQLSISGAGGVSFTSNLLGGPRLYAVKGAVPAGTLGWLGKVSGGGGVVKSWNGSGQLTVSGAGLSVKGKAFAASGQLTLSGSAPRARAKAFTASGQLTLSGAGLTQRVTLRSFTASGQLTVFGAFAVSKGKAFAPSGQLTVSGVSATSFVGLLNKQYAGSGQLTVSGASLLARTKAFFSSGQLTTSGAALVAKSKAFLPSGQLTVSGSPPRARTKAFVGGGQLTLSGAASTQYGTFNVRSYTGAGQLTLSGAALLAKVRGWLASGQLTTSGASPHAQSKAFTASGQVYISGAAVWARSRSFAGSGQVIISGSALTQSAGSNAYSGTGQLTVSGTAILSRVRSYSATGQLTIVGAAVLAKLRSWVPSGGLTTDGGAQWARTRPYLPTGQLRILGAGVYSWTQNLPFYHRATSADRMLAISPEARVVLSTDSRIFVTKPEERSLEVMP